MNEPKILSREDLQTVLEAFTNAVMPHHQARSYHSIIQESHEVLREMVADADILLKAYEEQLTVANRRVQELEAGLTIKDAAIQKLGSTLADVRMEANRMNLAINNLGKI